MARPGIMLYFDILEPIRVLPDSDKGRLLVAMLEYGQSGIVPDFDGMLALAWGFVKPKLDRDCEEYNRSVLRRQYATACRERKRKGEPEISFDEWMLISGNIGNQVLSHDTNDNQWYPTTTASATVTPSPTTNSTTSATVAVAASKTPEEPTNLAAATADRKLKIMHGELGKGVVALSDSQIDDLLDKLGLDMFDHYIDKLANFIIRNDAKVKNHYETILKWWRQDSNVEDEI